MGMFKAGKGGFGEGYVDWWATESISAYPYPKGVKVPPSHLEALEAAMVEAKEKGHPVRVDRPVALSTVDSTGWPLKGRVVLVHHRKDQEDLFFVVLETSKEFTGIWTAPGLIREGEVETPETPEERPLSSPQPSGEGVDFRLVSLKYPWEARGEQARALKGEIAQGGDRSVVVICVSGYRGMEGPQGEGCLLVHVSTDHLLAQGLTRFDLAGWTLAKEVSRYAGLPWSVEPLPTPRLHHFALLPYRDPYPLSPWIGIPALLLWKAGASALLELEDGGEAREIPFSAIDLLEQDLGLVALDARARGEKLWEALQKGIWTQGLRRSRVRGTLFAWREGQVIHLVVPWRADLVFWTQVEPSRVAEFLEGNPHVGACPACGGTEVALGEDPETLEMGDLLECGACGTFLEVASLHPLRVEVVENPRGPLADCIRCGYLIRVPDKDEVDRDRETTCPECGYHFALDWKKVDAGLSGL